MRHKPKVRVTLDQKTGKVINTIIKTRIADLNVYSPKTAFDWRVSANIEMPYLGEIEGLQPSSDRGGGDRNKDRLSYRHLAYHIDLTQVTDVNFELLDQCGVMFAKKMLEYCEERTRA